MSFNKTKAMRNAERYLTQGKIQAAINEYKQVVENDPKDINSRNMLGDLYTKANDSQAAVNCYREVAEHYNSQGFAKKAIAIYNKIYRIDPSSIEVATKLADLYETRGSNAEARKHYQEIAKRYEERGHKTEVLAIWEKIAKIAPNDTEIYLKIAEAYWQSDRMDEAVKSFIEAGKRLTELDKHEAAVTAYSRALEINSEEIQAIKGLVESQIILGFPEDAAAGLAIVLENQPYNQDINYLLIDCYYDMGKPEKAEEVIIKLVEREPANYTKLLELIDVYLEIDDLDSSIRILSMTSEHLLVGGESDRLLEFINEVLARNIEHIGALRLLARYHGWQRDELELQQTLERLADSAYLTGAIEDERYALAQYLLIAPHDVKRSSRLKEIDAEYGFEGNADDRLLNPNSTEIPTFESFETLNNDEDTTVESGFEILSEKDVVPNTDLFTEVSNEIASHDENFETQEISDNYSDVEPAETYTQSDFVQEKLQDESASSASNELSPTDELHIDEEIESIKFYIDQGYTGLAAKSLAELQSAFGLRDEFVELRNQLPNLDDKNNESAMTPIQVESDLVDNIEKYNQQSSIADEVQTDRVNTEIEQQDHVDESFESANVAVDIQEGSTQAEKSDENVAESYERTETIESTETVESPESIAETLSEDASQEIAEPKPEGNLSNSFDDFKDALGFDDTEEVEQNDFEEHYQHAVVYQEMGMLEEAIREYQDAVNCVEAIDGTSRFLNCCTLIGHCFMQKEMPNLALSWFEKAIENADLNDNETLGVYYEIANAHEKNGSSDKALEQFEMIYALDVDYRNTKERLETLRADVLTTA